MSLNPARLACALLIALVFGGQTLHAANNDPFAVDQGLGLRSEQRLASRVGDLPCANGLPDAPLQVLDVIDLALCNHPLTRELWASARSQAALVGAGRAAWYPRIDARFSENQIYNDGNTYNQHSLGLNLSWLMFDSGQRAATLEYAKHLLDAANATRNASLQGLMLASMQAYFAAQAAQSALVAAIESERAANEGAEAATVRYRVGAATPSDTLQARTALSQAVLNRVKAEGALRTAQGVLANAMGFDAQSTLTLGIAEVPESTSKFIRDVDALVADARRLRPDLQAAEMQSKAARASVEVAAAAGQPTLTLTATPIWQKVAGISSDVGTLGLTLNVPLFYGFDTHYRVRSAQALADARDAQRDRLSSQIALDVWRAYQTLQTATQSLAATQDLLASAEASERVALGRYKAGVGNVLDLLNAQSALAGARSQRIQAVFDWQLARVTLAQAMGTLDYSSVQGGATAGNGRP